MKIKKIILKILDIFAGDLLNNYILYRFKKKKLPKDFLNDLKKLKKNDYVLDIGANIGLVTECFAKTGCKVVSFEPNKYSFKQLKKMSLKYKNIKIFNAAAGIKKKIVKIYHHENFKLKSLKYSQASSLLKEKKNVDVMNFHFVKMIDLAKYIKKNRNYYKIMKIDIEGYEIELLNHLINKNVLSKIGRIYVEFHDNKNVFLKRKTEKLKQRIKKLNLQSKFKYTWF